MLKSFVNYIVSLNEELNFNPEIASLEGRIHRERWLLTQDLLELETAIASYLRAYEADKTQYYPGINAAELALAKGDAQLAERLFREILPICEQLQSEQTVSYWVDFTVGAIYLGLDDVDAAIAEYKKGINRIPAPQLRDRESAAKGAARMSAAKKLPDEVIEKIKALLA